MMSIIKLIDFPKNEHKYLYDRLNKNLPIYTTRIKNEFNRYKKGDVLDTPFGIKVKVADSIDINDIKQHPFYGQLTKPQRNILKSERMNVIKLIPTGSYE